MSESVGKNLLSSIIYNPNGLNEYIRLGLQKEFFIGTEEDLFDLVHGHIMKYGVTPAPATIEKELGYELAKAVEPVKYYYDHLKNRFIQQSLKKVMLEANDFLKDKQPAEALGLLQDIILKLTLKVKARQIIDFSASGLSIIKDEYKKKLLLGDQYGIQTGWEYFDSMFGGLVGGDVLALVGRPATGKTYNTLYMAHHAWSKQKKVPLIVSMEMKPVPLVQRITAMHTKKPITKLKNAALTTKSFDEIVKSLVQVKQNGLPFWIVDGNLAATVQDIILLSRQLNPDVVYVDGAYLLRHHNPKIGGWEKVKDNIEGLKEHIASDMDIPLIASYQFNRQAVKYGKKEGMGLEHIGGTDAIGQIASIVLGLLEPEDIENIRKKKIEILKGRNGEIGEWNINWIFDSYPFMDFSQIKEENPVDLQFI